MKTPSFKRTLLLSAIAAISLPLQAETSLDPLVVTVTTPLRMSQPVDQTLAATTVITRADIERQQPESVAQLLRGTPGVEFASTGGSGSMTSLFLRGSNSNHTLVLIDGVKANNPTDGSFRWEFLPVSQIERIEIVRGPQSSIWGADAIGGVVNIITRSPIQAGTQGEIRVGAGQQNTQLTDANFSAANETTRFNSSLSYRKSDGFNATQADTTGEKDGFEHYAVRLQVEQDIDDQNTVSAGYLRSQGTNEYDNSCDTAPPPDFQCISNNAFKQNFVLQTINFGLKATVTDSFTIDSNFSRTAEDRKEFREGVANGRVKTERDQASVKSTYRLENIAMVMGLDAQKERLLEASDYLRNSREIYGVFAQTSYDLNEFWQLSAGIRHDKDQFFGEKTTGNLGLQWIVSNSNTLGASIAQGYRAPNLLELYGPISWGSNPELQPEKSLNYELYWRYKPTNDLNTELRLFQNEIDNLIVGNPNNSWKFNNINEARIRGAEVSVTYSIENFNFNSAITLQDPVNRQTDTLLTRRAREHARFDIDYAVSNWGAGVTLEGQSKRYDFGNQRMGGYALVNTRAHWHLSPDWTLRAKIDNLFDKDYEQAVGFNTQGRYFETSLTYRF
ncbi:TonB-dependent receptor domain-containing protein [Nitrincola schmidtii]|uniref:TonB-dependent receptor domain-containing protein n=1 Tax=Nitrincola schmidtii TaxID=1730894 RepID=UPI00124C2B0B|nr:TonB-dependent receptor [Nitrincola schmidtii]